MHDLHFVQDDVTSQINSLTLRNQGTQLAKWKASPAAAFLAQRTFGGLEQRLGEDAPAEVEEGRSGIARGYTDEPGFHKTDHS
jgi:diphthamide biosynthesis protein 2